MTRLSSIAFMVMVMVMVALHFDLGAAETTVYGSLTDTTRDYIGELPVFPGAEGFGTTSKAGRGGAIVRVKNLNAEGEGSLRAALATAGPRVVVFEVGGVIDLEKGLEITEPFITVAGQTAPAPGITVIGAGIVIKTHDVLMQHLRFRIGDRKKGPKPESRDAITVEGGPDVERERTRFVEFIAQNDDDGDGKITYEQLKAKHGKLTPKGWAFMDENKDNLLTVDDLPVDGGTPSPEAYNVVIDHCSAAWGIDEVASTWWPGVHDVTFSNCIISEALLNSLHSEGPHSRGLLIGDHSKRVSVIRNFMAHNDFRHPLIKGDVTTQVVNNLIYNPRTEGIGLSDPEDKGPTVADVIGNVMVLGPSSRRRVAQIYVQEDMKPGTKIYLQDNVLGDTPLKLNAATISSEPLLHLTPLTVLPSAQVAEAVLAEAGARPGERDEADLRVVKHFRERSGAVIDSQEEVGGYPVVPPVHHELQIPDAPNEDADGDGYTNLEEWLHAQAAAVSE